MPEIRHYEVEQTRVVRVTANSAADAAVIAAAAFEHGQSPTNNRVIKGIPDEMFGNTSGPITETGLHVRKDIL